MRWIIVVWEQLFDLRQPCFHRVFFRPFFNYTNHFFVITIFFRCFALIVFEFTAGTIVVAQTHTPKISQKFNCIHCFYSFVCLFVCLFVCVFRRFWQRHPRDDFRWNVRVANAKSISSKINPKLNICLLIFVQAIFAVAKHFFVNWRQSLFNTNPFAHSSAAPSLCSALLQKPSYDALKSL